MVRVGWKLLLGTGLVLISVAVFGLHILLFHDAHWLEKYLVFYLGFLPVEVIVVTLILDRLIEMRERQERMEKMNMVIGLFFSEIGTSLLRMMVIEDRSASELRNCLQITGQCKPDDFNRIRQTMKGHEFRAEFDAGELTAIKELLSSKRPTLVRLLENPVLLEHEVFTNLLRAVFHLAEELDYRGPLDQLPDSDIAHLSRDTSRAYELLALQWLDYIQYLEGHYPYLFSLALRTNPFDEKASPVVAE
ncbi:hypothetical protein [Methanocella sp. MCL-LM]|uniref:hypothetical protein n=1 Tax=Methanocella sp. MCL-LM TaxID=3412035 RepID=UPI003C77B625